MSQELIVEKSVEIAASTHQVWRVLTDPDMILQWMGGAHIESTWELGRDITFTLELIDEKTRLTFRQENFHSEVEYKHANFFWGVAIHVMKNLLEQQSDSPPLSYLEDAV